MELDSTVSQIAPGLLRYCIGVDGNPEEGEEIAQEALTALVAYWRKRGPPASPKAFVFTVAKRVARRRRWKRRLLVPLELVVDGHHSPSAEADPLKRRELEEALDTMKCLSKREREALLLVVVGEFPVRDAARVLGISGSALKMRIHRARRKLAHHLEHNDESNSE
jgi:RNA polymerase sigma-70 factor (ECF subfamily)